MDATDLGARGARAVKHAEGVRARPWPRAEDGRVARGLGIALALAVAATKGTGCRSPSGDAASAPSPAPRTASTAAPAVSTEAQGAGSSSALAASSRAEEEALARANEAADELGRTLRARLLAAMREGGPEHAVSVCADEAAGLAASVRERTGVHVGRASTKLRNPANAPPPFVAAWLEAQGPRKAADVAGYARVEEGVARVVRPIAVEGPCLTCHGARPSPSVRALLDARYPNDRATGYEVGDLRGALYAEVPVR
jgi:hypothetical protein